jgi:hypothetical protein
MKRYIFKHIFYCQHELTYGEDILVKEILGELAETISGDIKFGEAIERLIEKKIPPRLMAIILKPYQPTIIHGLWNAFWLGRYKLTSDEIINKMKNSEVMEVLGDFFLLNTKWMNGSGNIVPGLASFLPPKTTGNQ